MTLLETSLEVQNKEEISPVGQGADYQWLVIQLDLKRGQIALVNGALYPAQERVAYLRLRKCDVGS